ncbi:DEKNAAC101565 [Brettanomyces naardenensis]|uniref:DEKNAAC101565 n=1 Tax=Brettanomyces naardenensis TaxID=13370 RepID=A0A448YIF1_BRENA|nr:DEKNAAC101565 [Brettanomyces naardenensis]
MKPRTMPVTLIKRARKTSNESLEEDKTTIPVLPFKKRSPEQDNEAWKEAYDYADLPPKRSLFDFNRPNEDQVGSNLLIDTPDFADLAKRPDDYLNAFNRYTRSRVEAAKEVVGQQVGGGLPFEENKSHLPTTNPSSQNAATRSTTRPTPVESSVIIYGFNDSNFDLIIDHFTKFGTILEDFHNSLRRSRPNKMNYPIFMGEGWVKITYGNPGNAIRALRENDSIDDQGHIIGVVPYSRKGLEELLNRKIPDSLDVGNGLASLHIDPEEITFPEDSNGIGELLRKSFTMGVSVDEKGKKGNELRLKDGSKLINSKKNTKKKERNGVVDGWVRFMFGRGEV